MDLYSFGFLLFLIILFISYYTIFKNMQWICLLIFSIAFYAFSGIYNLIYILLTATTVYYGTVLMQQMAGNFQKASSNKNLDRVSRKKIKASIEKKRRIVFWTVIIINFGMLALLKYCNPFKGGLLIPLGISFYIFTAIGYLIDIYFEKYDTESNFFKFLLFISFFPQLIQGPINRYDKMKNQLYANRGVDWNRCKRALVIILFGMLKKYAVANLLVDTISQILDNPTEDTPGAAIVIGILLYSAQQYADFSGGIDMVMGIAELFGIKMMPNFRQPYFSVSLGDFWRRWHISLGAWMRDYVFYPLAITKPMQKVGKWAKRHLNVHLGRVLPASIANIVVFFLVGLWHGAQWHFILWGLYNGIVIAFSDICSPIFERVNHIFSIKPESKFLHLFRILRTFCVVNIGWYFDRIYDIKDCLMCMKNTVFSFKLEKLGSCMKPILDIVPRKAFIIAAISLIIVFIDSVIKENGRDTIELLDKCPAIIRWGVYYVMIFLVLCSFSFAIGAGGFMYANY